LDNGYDEGYNLGELRDHAEAPVMLYRRGKMYTRNIAQVLLPN
jgi:hypothetical protein